MTRKLTFEDKVAIRKLYDSTDMSYSELAQRFNVSASTIGNAINSERNRKRRRINESTI